MDFRFVAYDPQTGAKLYQLPRANSVNIGDTFGTRGTLELTYSAKAVNARDLPTFLEVQAEVTFDNGHSWTETGPSLLRLSGEHEDTDQAGMRTLRFVGREWLLGKARVGNGDLELIDGKRPFYRASPGQILRTLILEAQDRGAADGIEIGNFTAAKDSSGNAWAKVATIYYSPGLPIGSVLENLVEQGMCDYRMDGRTIELYNPETAMGRDLTTGDNPVRIHGAVTEAPVKYTLEDLANSALLMGDEGFELEVDNPTAPDDYGRLEVTIEQGGVSDSGTARVMVDEALQRGSREVREITRSQSAAGAAFLPLRDYRVGDYVQVHTGGEWVRYRVREIQLARDGQEWTIHTIINDRLQELLLKLAKRTNGIVNGSKGSGGDGTRPAPPEKPGIQPAAPEGLVIDQQVYLDRQGVARGAVTAGWGSVTESTKGTAVEIGGYELWWRENKTQSVWTRVAVTDGSINVSHSPVVLTDAFGNAMEYQWRVRAIAQASTRPGPFSDVVTLTMTQDTEPPNTPSLPTVTTDLRIVTVDVDGLDEFGEAMPVDFDHTRIYFAVAEDMVGAEQVGTLTQPGSWNSGSMTPDVPVWVAVSAVDHVGNESAMTPAQSVTPQKLVDDDSIRDAVAGIDDKINNAVDDLNQAIDNIVIDDAGIATYWMPTEPDETTDPPPKAGFLWFDTSAAGKNKLHRFDGARWVSAADERIDTISQAQDDLASEVDRVRTSIDGKNAVTQSLSSPTNQYGGAINDRWEVMSSMGSGGRVLSTWRWDGTVWVSIRLDDAMIANLDAGKIKSGYIDADRLEAGSIKASSIAVGDFSNLATIDPIRGVNVSRPSSWATETEGDYTKPKDTSQNYLMFKDRTDTVPFQAGDELRVKLSGKTVGSDSVTATIRLWGYPANQSGTTSGRESVIGDAITFTTTEQVFTATIKIPVSFGQGVTLRSWIVGLGGPGSWRDKTIHDVRIRDLSVYRMTGQTLIQEGAVTTDKIAAGAITSDSGVIGDFSAGSITSGTIDADRIGANTITGDKLLIGDVTELAPSPASYEDEWSLNGGSFIFDWSSAYDGAGIRIVDGGSEAFGPMRDTEPGDVWHLEAYAGQYSGATSDLKLRVAFYDADKSYVTNRVAATGTGSLSGTVTTPDGAVYARIWLNADPTIETGWLSVRDIHGKRQAGATLIEDGAITTDKILANAITAGKIAALAIEADHISANAITADKINAGAIDGKLITGARIRTSASGARVELNSEGMKAYDTSGSTVLTTATADGSIDMRGNLRQVIKGVTMSVGDNFAGVNPGISWTDTNNFAAPPAVIYGEDSGVRNVYIQGPGTATDFSGLKVKESGSGFEVFARTGSGDSRKNWIVNADVTGGLMRLGSSTSDAPYMYFRRGAAADDGAAWFGYRHPNGAGYSSLSLKDSSGGLYVNNWQGTRMGSLVMDAANTVLSAGTRDLFLNGADMVFSPDGGLWLNSNEIYMNSLPNDSGATEIGRVKGRIHSVYSSRKYKLLEESIESTVDSFEDKLLSVDAKTWIDRTRADRIADYQTAIANGDEPVEDITDIGGLERIPGVIAEDFDEAGLEVFVRYDDNGEPQSVAYDRIGPALIPIIRRLRDRVDALETKLGENNAA